MLDLREERMSGAMTKWHIGGLPRAAVLHHFTEPDRGPPHSHPFAFTSFILSGGYTEEVFDRDTGATDMVSHMTGTSFHVPARHIHRIVHMPATGCWTLILPGPWEQKSGFYEFRTDGPYYRPWDRAEFEKVL